MLSMLIKVALDGALGCFFKFFVEHAHARYTAIGRHLRVQLLYVLLQLALDVVVAEAGGMGCVEIGIDEGCLLYTSPSPRDS